jgi:hypothetical protein
MKSNNKEKAVRQKKILLHSNGVTYFDKKTERAFFFIMTLVMLCLGILVRFGAF